MLSEVKCNLCKSKDSKPIVTLNKFKMPLCVVKCRRCGLMYQNPQLDFENMKSFYSQDYYTGEGDVSYTTDFNKYKAVSIERLRIIEKMRSPGKLLDIGCHSGIFLEAAKERGWDSWGIDVSPFIVEKAKQRGLNVTLGELQDIKFESLSFDVVTMYEVIEHLFSPLETLQEIHRILKGNGLLIVQTANMDSLRVKIIEPKNFYFLPVHVYYFTRKTIVKMLQKAGFKIIIIFQGSEFDMSTELKLFKDEVPVWKLFLRKLFNNVSLMGYALNSSMVVYAAKCEKL